jgi:hypothetical protein
MSVPSLKLCGLNCNFLLFISRENVFVQIWHSLAMQSSPNSFEIILRLWADYWDFSERRKQPQLKRSNKETLVGVTAKKLPF